MRLNKSSNPAMSARLFEKAGSAGIDGQSMTINGTITKTAIMLLLIMASAAYTWKLAMSAEAVKASTLAIGGGIGGFIMAMVTIFRPKSSGFTAPVYAILQGLFLGAISATFNSLYEGIVFQAVLLTIGTLFTMLFLYRSGRIRATPRFRRGVMMATGAVFFAYLLSWIMNILGMDIGFLHGTGRIGIILSLVIIVIAALNLILDFDMIERGAKMGAPKYMEWFGAFGLMVTLVWLYIEFLRLLSMISSRN